MELCRPRKQEKRLLSIILNPNSSHLKFKPCKGRRKLKGITKSVKSETMKSPLPHTLNL